MKTYVIGDIHGMYVLLEAALETIAADAADEPRIVILLGDYIDRGDGSRAVIARLREGPRHPEEIWVPLRGNHEQILIDSARHTGNAAGTWMANGGWATLQQYMAGKDLDEDALRADADFLDDLPLLYEDDHRYYVHAGLNPAKSLIDQTAEDMLWIRDEFLVRDHDFGKLVVHGHTITDDLQVCIAENRICLDTGAFEDKGALSVMIFAHDQRSPLGCFRVFRPSPDASVVVEHSTYRIHAAHAMHRHPADVLRRR